MTDPTLTISIDRSGMAGSLSPLLLSAALDGTTLGIVGFQRPASQQRIVYASDAPDVHGSEPVAASYQQAILGFDWMRDGGATETQVQASYAEVEAAIGQFAYEITTQISGALAQVWSAQPGSMVPAARTYEDLVGRNPVFAVTIPVYPIPGAP